MNIGFGNSLPMGARCRGWSGVRFILFDGFRGHRWICRLRYGCGSGCRFDVIDGLDGDGFVFARGQEHGNAHGEHEEGHGARWGRGLSKHDGAGVIVFDSEAQGMRSSVAEESYGIIGQQFGESDDVFVARGAMSAQFGAGHRVPILGTGLGDVEAQRRHIAEEGNTIGGRGVGIWVGLAEAFEQPELVPSPANLAFLAYGATPVAKARGRRSPRPFDQDVPSGCPKKLRPRYDR